MFGVHCRNFVSSLVFGLGRDSRSAPAAKERTVHSVLCGGWRGKDDIQVIESVKKSERAQGSMAGEELPAVRQSPPDLLTADSDQFRRRQQYRFSILEFSFSTPDRGARARLKGALEHAWRQRGNCTKIAVAPTPMNQGTERTNNFGAICIDDTFDGSWNKSDIKCKRNSDSQSYNVEHGLRQ